jgi:hypothetical protein
LPSGFISIDAWVSAVTLMVTTAGMTRASIGANEPAGEDTALALLASTFARLLPCAATGALMAEQASSVMDAADRNRRFKWFNMWPRALLETDAGNRRHSSLRSAEAKPAVQ